MLELIDLAEEDSFFDKNDVGRLLANAELNGINLSQNSI